MKNWIVEELAAVALADGLQVYTSKGLYIPQIGPDEKVFWWIPTLEAAEFKLNKLVLPLMSAGPRWLSNIPEKLTKRPIWSGPLSEASSAPNRGWAKVSEAKIFNMEARWCDDTGEFFKLARSMGAQPGTEFQVSPIRLYLEEEFRFFVLHNKVLTGSAYLVNGIAYDPDKMPTPKYTKEALAFAQDSVDEIDANQPPAYTLGVALDKYLGWLVLESNPIWSSAYYGSDLTLFYTALKYSIDLEFTNKKWHWAPDPWLNYRLSSRPQLPKNPLETRLLPG